MHVHFPEFVRKDGPSAGVTMATALASALMKVPVRRDLAMTGEITLRGRVMPIGGLKEKLLAAHRGGITTVIVPKENRKDLREVPRRVLKALRVVLVEHMDDVLREALVLPDPDAVFGAAAERARVPRRRARHARRRWPSRPRCPGGSPLPASSRGRDACFRQRLESSPTTMSASQASSGLGATSTRCVGMIRRALLSVSDKSGLVPFARALAARGVELLSSGGTPKAFAARASPVRRSRATRARPRSWTAG